MINKDMLLKIINNIADTIIANKEFLTDLDTAIGDSDHGINMSKGFRAVKESLEKLDNPDCGVILKTVAMTLISKVGGASGPLYGTAFMKAAGVVVGKSEIDNEDIIKMYNEAILGIIGRGKAKKGEKTMLDALIPAYDALKESLEQGNSLVIAMKKAEDEAAKGVEYTKTIVATKGRASYLGERSIGHQDPGATSSYLIIKTIAHTLEEYKA